MLIFKKIEHCVNLCYKFANHTWKLIATLSENDL